MLIYIISYFFRFWFCLSLWAQQNIILIVALSKYIYDLLSDDGYRVKRVTVYETPNNCAVYEAGDDNDI